MLNSTDVMILESTTIIGIPFLLFPFFLFCFYSLISKNEFTAIVVTKINSWRRACYLTGLLSKPIKPKITSLTHPDSF